MRLTKDPGRFAGFLYVVSSIPGFFSLIYVPGKLFVHGDAAATADNIVAHETLFRAGVVTDLICQGMFIFVGLALYHLFKEVNARHALVMLISILVSIPISFVNEVNSNAALIMAKGAQGAGYLAVFDEPQRDALARFFLNLRSSGFDIAGIFWGLWLFPLGMLVYRSRFLPRLLGVLLMLGTFAYLANSFTALLAPQYEVAVSRWASPVQAVEVVFMLWLLIRGTNPKQVAGPASSAATT